MWWVQTDSFPGGILILKSNSQPQQKMHAWPMAHVRPRTLNRRHLLRKTWNQCPYQEDLEDCANTRKQSKSVLLEVAAGPLLVGRMHHPNQSRTQQDCAGGDLWQICQNANAVDLLFHNPLVVSPTPSSWSDTPLPPSCINFNRISGRPFLVAWTGKTSPNRALLSTPLLQAEEHTHAMFRQSPGDTQRSPCKLKEVHATKFDCMHWFEAVWSKRDWLFFWWVVSNRGGGMFFCDLGGGVCHNLLLKVAVCGGHTLSISIYLSIYLTIYLSIYLSIYLIYLS